MDKIKVSLIFNPTAGSLRRDPRQVERLSAALAGRGIEVSTAATQSAGHSTVLAAEAVERGVDVVLVCGGDGTVNEAAQSLIGAETALAVWPGGTANVLASELRLPRSPEGLADLIAAGSILTISVGRAMKPETGWQRYFLLMAGIGLDAAIVQSVNLNLKRMAGIGAYLVSGLDYLARLPLTPFVIDFNGCRHESTFAVISNSAHYAVWFRLAPEAKMDDDKLDICLFNSRSRLVYLSYAAMSLAGRHTRSKGVVYQEATRARANSNDAALVQLDGEVVGNLPMQFEIVPRALKVVAPLFDRDKAIAS